MSALRRIVVLGSTGSVGVSTLDLLEQACRHGSAEVEVLALTAGRNVRKLAEQALRWRPRMAVIADTSLLGQLRGALEGSGIETAAGPQAIVEAAAMGADWVMAAIVGVAGLAPTLAAARSGAVVALANKESLVCAGPWLIETARQAGGVLGQRQQQGDELFHIAGGAQRALDLLARGRR